MSRDASLRIAAVWLPLPDVGSLAGKPLRLRVELKDADLYASDAAYPAERARILLVEDNEINQELAVALLTPAWLMGAWVDVAENHAFSAIIGFGGLLSNIPGAEIATRLMEKAFYYLEVPIELITGYDVIIPLFNREKAYLPNEQRILRAARKALKN